MAQIRVRRFTELLVAGIALGTGACGGGSNVPALTAAPPDVTTATTAASATASPILPGPGLAFEAYLEGLNSAEVHRLIEEAQRAARFDLRLPVSLPTSASHPAAVRVAPATGDGLAFRLALAYSGGSTFEYENRSYESTFELLFMPFRMGEAQGEPWRSDMAGYAIYRLLNGVDSNGLPVQTIYTARKDQETIIAVFTGEQPTPESLEAMLVSFVPLAEWKP
ncbi:MAG: hypothetical protein R3B97_06785 [Dehalococcoidia bacterium]|nr:hypothetical protein [Dehalococcoidia bacterium]